MKTGNFAEMKIENGEIMYLNTRYIIAYRYIKEQDKTAVGMLGESNDFYFPGDQTHEIRASINWEG